MVCEEVPDQMRPAETAFLIKRHCSGAVPCSHIQDIETVSVRIRHKTDHVSAVSPSLKFRSDRQIFDLQDPLALISHDTHCPRAVILKDIQIAPLKIPVDHILLLIRQKKQGQVFFFVCFHFSDLHDIPC